jgi:hypothetical protein
MRGDSDHVGVSPLRRVPVSRHTPGGARRLGAVGARLDAAAHGLGRCLMARSAQETASWMPQLTIPVEGP